MEEREPPPDNANHKPSPNGQPTTPPAESANHDPAPESSQSVFRSGTYVVQVPKDQIYRVPPTEHAQLAQQRNAPQQKRRCCNWCFCSLFAVVIVLVFGLVGGVNTFFLEHDNPSFIVEHFLVLNPPHPNHQQHPDYNIGLKAQNPNQHTSILYDQHGDACLSFKHKEIAVGKYPPFNQSPKNSNTFRIVLNGSKIALPKEIEKGMKNKNSKEHVLLSLSMNVPVQLKTGALKTGSRKISVDCSLTVDTLAKTAHILSQECHTRG
ncbi:unnamed protein product [Ilex paraguariensis]|uniref:Late embryogenesis abundant protein LEA-2 subgroup domain-containing protein n=1 Tax=Ilex paraguariensis TaxID=185542 RepID=A0ABC8UZC7_9AQUA